MSKQKKKLFITTYKRHWGLTIFGYVLAITPIVNTIILIDILEKKKVFFEEKKIYVEEEK